MSVRLLESSVKYNPRKIHQVLADCLCLFNLDQQPINNMADDPFEEYLAAAAFSIRCSYNQTHGH